MADRDIQAKREWLVDELVRLGVSRDTAITRVESLTSGEIHAMYENMENLPVGAGFLEWLGDFLEYAFYFVVALLVVNMVSDSGE
jgi:hypothetical protein